MNYTNMEAKDCKCYKCGKPAVAFYPVVDPDIPAQPYCADCLEKAMISMAKAVFKDDKPMQMLAIAHAKEAAKKYRKEI